MLRRWRSGVNDPSPISCSLGPNSCSAVQQDALTKRSTHRILTTRTGSLPRPPRLRESLLAKDRGETIDEAAFDRAVTEAVTTAVRRQGETGIDVVSDGEMSKYSWLWYMFERLDGFAPVENQPFASRSTSAFGGLGEYGDLASRTYASAGLDRPRPVMACVAPVTYSNLEPERRDLANLRAALADVHVEDAFLPAVAPGTVGNHANHYYDTDEAYLFAIADAMNVEYAAIVDAGFIVQLDEPGLVTGLNGPRFEGRVPEFRAYVELCIEALNCSLRGIPRDRVSLHVCWGNLPGPHHLDTPLEVVVDLILRAHVGRRSLRAPEAAGKRTRRSNSGSTTRWRCRVASGRPQGHRRIDQAGYTRSGARFSGLSFQVIRRTPRAYTLYPEAADAFAASVRPHDRHLKRRRARRATRTKGGTSYDPLQRLDKRDWCAGSEHWSRNLRSSASSGTRWLTINRRCSPQYCALRPRSSS
jgi:5-methyltetrahydropteroyltriglutamate--homocysteine methyltransferase